MRQERTEADMRYPEGTPDWIKKFDYYNQVAWDARAMGNEAKALRFRRKAAEVLRQATGTGVKP